MQAAEKAQLAKEQLNILKGQFDDFTATEKFEQFVEMKETVASCHLLLTRSNTVGQLDLYDNRSDTSGAGPPGRARCYTTGNVANVSLTKKQKSQIEEFLK